MDVYTGDYLELVKLICHFKLVADMVRGGPRKFVYDGGRPAFLKREVGCLVQIGTSRSEFMIAHMGWSDC